MYIYTYFSAYIYISFFFTWPQAHTDLATASSDGAHDNLEKEAKPGDDYCLLLCGASPPCSWEAAPMGLLKVKNLIRLGEHTTIFLKASQTYSRKIIHMNSLAYQRASEHSLCFCRCFPQHG